MTVKCTWLTSPVTHAGVSASCEGSHSLQLVQLGSFLQQKTLLIQGTHQTFKIHDLERTQTHQINNFIFINWTLKYLKGDSCDSNSTYHASEFSLTLMLIFSAIVRSVCRSNCFWLVFWECKCSAFTSRFAALRWLMPEPSWERSKSRFPRPSEYVSARLFQERETLASVSTGINSILLPFEYSNSTQRRIHFSSPAFHDLHHILCITFGCRFSELQTGSCLQKNDTVDTSHCSRHLKPQRIFNLSYLR